MTPRFSPLLFLHGVGGGHHAWERQLPYFGGLGYPSHAWDQPGYGKSPLVEPYDLEHVCAALALYDRRDVNGTEQRAFAGNFLYSTGANEVAGRHTLGHFDLPFRHCTIELDGKAVVKEGKLVA